MSVCPACYRNGRIYRRLFNFELSVGNGEGRAEIVVVITEFVCRKPHGICSGICSGHGSRYGADDLRRVVERVGADGIISAYGMLRCIIIYGIGVSGYCDSDCFRIDSYLFTSRGGSIFRVSGERYRPIPYIIIACICSRRDRCCELIIDRSRSFVVSERVLHRAARYRAACNENVLCTVIIAVISIRCGDRHACGGNGDLYAAFCRRGVVAVGLCVIPYIVVANICADRNIIAESRWSVGLIRAKRVYQRSACCAAAGNESFFRAVVNAVIRIGSRYGCRNSGDRQAAVRNFKCYGEIGVGIGELRSRKFHIIGSDICSDCRSCSGENNIVCIIKITVGRSVISAYGLFRAGIVLCVGVSGNRDCYSFRAYGKSAFCKRYGIV